MKIEFIKPFANKKKGDFFDCDSMLASRLVRQDKVAKYVKADSKKKEAKK